MKSSDEELQIRATFKDTKRRQKAFRNFLDELIEDNRCILSDERDKFFDLIADSTFGLGTKPITLFFKCSRKLTVDNLEEFVRVLAYYSGSMVDSDFFYKSLGKHISYNVSIGELWEAIRNRLGGVTAEALAMSARMSKEQTHFGSSEAALV